jgi:hypothetical protein
MFPSSDLAEQELGSDRLDGCRSGHAIHSSRGTADLDLVLVSSDSVTSLRSGLAEISAAVFRERLVLCMDDLTNGSQISVKRNAIRQFCAA